MQPISNRWHVRYLHVCSTGRLGACSRQRWNGRFSRLSPRPPAKPVAMQKMKAEIY